MPDLHQQFWTDVINIDPAGKWMERCSAEFAPWKKHYGDCAPALQRLKEAGSTEDIGRVSRFCRYQACFDTLCALEDCELPKRTSLKPEPLITAALSGRKPRGKTAEFIERLRQTLLLDDDGKWLLTLAKDKDPMVKEVGAAVSRLVNGGARVKDLAQLSIWSSYEACAGTLRLLHEADLEVPDDTSGLHEELLSADPSGLEGGPGSWPIVETKNKLKAKTTGGNEPLWRMRSGQAIAFSPDSKTLAVGYASGPVRLYDALTGQEKLVCEGVKAHIYRVAFSPDGKLLAVADQDRRLDICDAATGKLLSKITFPAHEISGLQFSRKTGELLRSAWTAEIGVIDPVTGKKKEPLRPSPNSRTVDALQVSADGSKVMATWKAERLEGTHVTIWSWPNREPLAEFAVPYSFPRGIGMSPEVDLVAVAVSTSYDNTEPGVLLIEPRSGKTVHRLKLNEPGEPAFDRNGQLLVSDGERLLFFDTRTWKQVRAIPGVDPYHIHFSPDGNLLAISGHRDVRVWKA